MTSSNVSRRESTRWVAPKTSYDGDDWGNEYDEYEYGAFPEGEETDDLAAKSTASPVALVVTTAASPQVPSDPVLKPASPHTDMGAPFTSNPPSEPVHTNVSTLAHPKSLASEHPSTELASEVPQSHQPGENVDGYVDHDHGDDNPGSRPESALGHGEFDTSDEDAHSIQDIYGFYENRYSHHPYSQMMQGHQHTYSQDAESSSFEQRFAASDRDPSLNETDSIDFPETVPHLRVSQHSRGPSTNTLNSDSDTPIPQVSALKIAKRAPGAHSRNASEDVASPELAGGEFNSQKANVQTPVNNLGSHDLANTYNNDAAGPSYDPDTSRYSHVESDIAELYIGPSEILDRPISTYQTPGTHMRSISDKSIREMLTPTLESHELESDIFSETKPTETPKTPAVPSLTITAATPLTVRTVDPPPPTTEPVMARTDMGYVDGPSDIGENDHGDSDSVGSGDSGEIGETDKTKGGDETNDPSPKYTPTAPLILPSERSAQKSATKEVPEVLQPQSFADITSALDHKDSDFLPSVPNYSNPTPTDIDTSLPSNQPSSAPNAPKETPKNSVNNQPTPSAALSAAPSPAQPIAAKVKRLPQVDFAAIYDSKISSEARTEQLKQLRVREAAYSTGLDTWLTATLNSIESPFKIYPDGAPIVGDSHALELPATAKMSNVVHSSATNTKEKLEKVGNKSKSFFAKVIR